MDIGLLFKVAGVGILVATMHYILKQAGKEEFAWIVTVGGLAIVLLMVVQVLAQLFDAVQTLFLL